MYWVVKEDGTYEVMDGQQRTLSICKYYSGEYSINWKGALKGFANLDNKEREQFLNYELDVYLCQNGTDAEKLEWFQVINIAGLQQLCCQAYERWVYLQNLESARRIRNGYLVDGKIRTQVHRAIYGRTPT